MKRTPELSVRQAEKLNFGVCVWCGFKDASATKAIWRKKLNFARGLKMNRTVVKNYIDLLEKTMRDSLLHKPESIFNADESGVQLTVGKPSSGLQER